MNSLAYTTFEHLDVRRPVERVSHIAGACRGKRVLDIGCLDETAFEKRDTQEWLHRRIASVAQTVTGIDLSDSLPEEGLRTAPNAHIHKGDGTAPDVAADTVDIIVAGEFIEHLENPAAFLRAMKERYPGKTLMISTPNGVSFANALLGTIGREAQHHDHLMTSTYKTLNTLCARAGCRSWQILPYRFYATELKLQSGPVARTGIGVVEGIVRIVERLFPLRSFGYVVTITL